jgi:recombinational DNA repair protein (RecF pathway)
MNNNTLLKVYLSATAVSVALFLISFAIGWHTLNNMRDMLGATLPFLFMACASLIAFGFTPEDECCAKSAEPTNVVQLRSVKYNSCILLRKIS